MISRLAKCISALAFLLIVSTITLAQQGAVKGIVKVKKTANDTPQPTEGLIVDIYRLDITAKYNTKTDKKGEYYYSLPAFGEYVISVSGPELSPVTSNKFRIGGDQPLEQNFELVPGDGKRLAQAEVVDYIKKGGAPPTNAKAAAEESQKLEEERAKIEKENAKIKADFEAVKKHVEAGVAFAQKNDYEGAIKEYKEAMAIDDAQSVVYAQLGQALFNLGAVRFNAKKKDEAKSLFTESATYAEKATKLAPDNAVYIKIYADSCHILAKQFGAFDFGEKAINAYNASSALETDPIKKNKMINRIADIYYSQGDMEKCSTTYEKVLTADPNNTEALKGKANVILATTTSINTPQDKARLEEAMGIYQKIIDVLPDGAEKTEVNGYIAYLQDTMKIEPPKDLKGKKDKDKKDKKGGK
ncbi:MAG: tetratricopeptide repeat protein [Acidobacteria bacterium]|nr:tetratricopeptide repeat protein [Acidobacteriota bacterium]